MDVDATARRRAAVLDRLGQGVLVVPAAEPRDLEREVLQDSHFRQDDYFFYLTGLETPSAWLVLTARSDRPDDVVLLLPARDPKHEQWTGVRLGPGPDAERLSGIPTTLDVASLDSLLRARSAGPGGPWFTVGKRGSGVERLRAAGIDEIRDATAVLDSLRLVKDSAELARLRRAVEITVEAQKAAMRAARPGMFEYELEAEIEYTFRRLGADRVGFPSIVGSGPNSTTLHYDVNRRQTAPGDLVVMDVGAEFGQYTADLTRTIPISGRFTERQKALYDLVLGTQQAVLEAVRPGVTLGELTQLARTYLRDYGGTLCGTHTCDVFFIHGLGHWLGMRVHDVGDYATPLAPGMVLTIEPGIYLPDEAAGIRIEDIVLVTEHGHEVLSAAAPRSTRDIEALMAGSIRAAAPQEQE